MTAIPQDDFWATPPTEDEVWKTPPTQDEVWATPPKAEEVSAPQGQLTTSEQRKREDLATSVLSRKLPLGEAAQQIPLQQTGKEFDPATQVELSPEEAQVNRQGLVSKKIYRQLAPEAMTQSPEGPTLEGAGYGLKTGLRYGGIPGGLLGALAGAFAKRAGAGVKMTPKGEEGYWKSMYPNAQIWPTPDGSFIIAEPGKPPRYADKPGLEAGDVADLSGAAIEAGPSMLAGTVGPAGAAAGAAGGQVLRQAVSAALPGDDELSVEERIAMPVISAGTGALTQAVAPHLARGISSIASKARHPFRTATQAMLGPEGRLAAQEGLDLAADTGVDLTAGQMSGSKILQGQEGKLRHAVSSADDMFAKDLGRIEQLHEGVKGAIQRTAPKEVSANEAVRAVNLTYRKSKSALYTSRSRQAAEDFGAVEAAAGGKPVFSIKKTLERMEELEKKNAGRPEVSKLLARERAKLMTSGRGVTTATKFQNKLSDWSEKSAFGKNRKARQLYTSLADALRTDLDDRAAIEALPHGEASKKVATLLKGARDRYKAASQTIEGFRNDLLETSLKLEKKDSPELFIKKLFSGSYGDEQIKKTLGTVQAIDDEAYLGLRRAGLEHLTSKASAKGSLFEAGAEMSPRAFVDLSQKNAKRIEALFAGDPSGLAQWHKLEKVAGRLADTKVGGDATTTWLGHLTGSLGVGTAAGSIAAYKGGDAKTVAAAAAGGMAFGLARKLGARFTTRKIMGMLNDPEQVRLLLRVVEPKAGTTRTQIAQAAMQLLALEGREEIILGEE